MADVPSRLVSKARQPGIFRPHGAGVKEGGFRAVLSWEDGNRSMKKAIDFQPDHGF